jgi:trans-2,3-dihydro-3-hydroxyanthranilate isomerase
MRLNRRRLFNALAAVAVTRSSVSPANSACDRVALPHARRFRFVHVDVFTSTPLSGNPLYVFTDARGLSDVDLQALARETRLNETTFVFPRDQAKEQEHGIRVRIFTPEGEIPFGGHPTLGTAAVLQSRRPTRGSHPASVAQTMSTIALDLNVGKVPVSFSADASENIVGEMTQVTPTFGARHDKATIAGLLNLSSSDIADDGPIETVSTGLPFIVVPLKHLSTLETLQIDREKMSKYLAKLQRCGFYYITRETSEVGVTLRARCLNLNGEDPATGSAAGCTAAWMVRNGITASDQLIHIRQGIEMGRASDLFVRAAKQGDSIVNVRVGGHIVKTMEGDAIL